MKLINKSNEVKRLPEPEWRHTKIEIITKVAKQIKIKRRILCVQDAN